MLQSTVALVFFATLAITLSFYFGIVPYTVPPIHFTFKSLPACPDPSKSSLQLLLTITQSSKSSLTCQRRLLLSNCLCQSMPGQYHNRLCNNATNQILIDRTNQTKDFNQGLLKFTSLWPNLAVYLQVFVDVLQTWHRTLLSCLFQTCLDSSLKSPTLIVPVLKSYCCT